jgi:hypothetical protein
MIANPCAFAYVCARALSQKPKAHRQNKWTYSESKKKKGGKKEEKEYEYELAMYINNRKET